MEKIIAQVKTVLEQISQQGKAQDSIGLLSSANSLASLRYNLADHWVKAKSKAEEVEFNYKRKTDEAFLKFRAEGKAIDEAKALARQETAFDFVDWLAADETKNRLSALRDDLATKISLVQSFASELRSQRNIHEL